jgi:hypothetical protein
LSVHVDELTSTVETEGPRPAAAGVPTTSPASPDDAARMTREALRRLARDEARTRAHGHGD